jgi:hypothetical protein
MGKCFRRENNRNGFWRVLREQPSERQSEVRCGGGRLDRHPLPDHRFECGACARCRGGHAAHRHVGDTGRIRRHVSTGRSPCRTTILRRFERAGHGRIADGEQSSTDQHYGEEPAKQAKVLQRGFRAQSTRLSSTNPSEESTSGCQTGASAPAERIMAMPAGDPDRSMRARFTNYSSCARRLQAEEQCASRQAFRPGHASPMVVGINRNAPPNRPMC